jgi:hypothetical protein
MTFGGYLVRTADRVVLVDVGVGPWLIAPPGIPAPYDGAPDSLRAEGLEPADVTDVVLTTCTSTIGWVSDDGVPVPARHTAAQSRVGRGVPPPVAELMAPVTDRLETWTAIRRCSRADARLARAHAVSFRSVVSSAPSASSWPATWRTARTSLLRPRLPGSGTRIHPGGRLARRWPRRSRTRSLRAPPTSGLAGSPAVDGSTRRFKYDDARRCRRAQWRSRSLRATGAWPPWSAEPACSRLSLSPMDECHWPTADHSPKRAHQARGLGLPAQ